MHCECADVVTTRHGVVLGLQVEVLAVFALHNVLAVPPHARSSHRLLLVGLRFTPLPLRLTYATFLLPLQLLLELTINLHLSLEQLVTELESFSVTTVPEEESHPGTEPLMQHLASMSREELLVEH